MKTQEVSPTYSKALASPRAVDARWYQIIFLSAFLFLGVLCLGWHSRWQHYLAVGAGALSSQLLAEWLSGRRQWSSWRSALISSLSLSLLLYTNHPLTMALAGVLAVSAKFVFRYRTKHFFNPANFAIIACLMFTGDAWITPGQWGSDVLLLFFFSAAGLTVLGKVGRIDTSFVFLGVFLLAQYLYQIVYLGWPMDVFYHKLTNGALLLFSFFMITDPRATPSARIGRVIWATCIALTAFVLLEGWYVYPAVFWALFLWSPLTPVFDKIFSGTQFDWHTSKDKR